MELNKSTRFALYAAVEMARHPGEAVSASQIAERYQISEHHVAKVLQRLCHARIVRSIRGSGGGYVLARDPAGLTMFDIVETFEIIPDGEGCVLRAPGETCGNLSLCRIREVLHDIQSYMLRRFKTITIATLAEGKANTALRQESPIERGDAQASAKVKPR